MPADLFPDFLIWPSAYERNRQFWLDEVADMCSRNDSAHDWTKWSRNEDAMTESLGDANPIIDLWSPSRERALRVVQFRVGDPLAGFGAWIDYVDELYETPLRTESISPELVISLALTEVTLGPARELLEPWVAGSPSIEEMQRRIERVTRKLSE